MLLNSNRPGRLGGQGLFISVRASTSDPWSTPVNLGAVFNSGVLEARPMLSFEVPNSTSIRIVPALSEAMTSTEAHARS